MSDYNYMERSMTEYDYEKVHALWMSIHHFGIRSIDDGKEAISRFIRRNPGISVVAESGSTIVGSILCGHDGRTGCFYHVCVRDDMRRRGIGSAMVKRCLDALRGEKISKISLFAFTDNELGNGFWKRLGFVRRDDMYNYEWAINENNITTIVESDS